MLDPTSVKPSAPPMDGLPPELRRWAVAAIFTTLALASLDTAIANIALPTIAADLHVSAADVVWVVNVYQIALVATLLPLGALGEIVGHERIYIGGVLLFTLASLGCALAWSLPSLVAARALQGLGASGIMAVNAALVRFVYPTRMMGRGFGQNALVVGTAMTLGPSIASAVLAVGSWPWAVCDQSPVRRDCRRDRREDLAEDAARRTRVRLCERDVNGGLSRSVHRRHRQRRARGAAGTGRGRTGRRIPDRLVPRSPECRSSGANVADRLVQATDVRPFIRHLGLLLLGAGPRHGRAAVLLRRRLDALAGRDRIFHDALAAGGGDDGADRRPVVGSLPGRHPRRLRSGAVRYRHGAAGDASRRSPGQPTSSGAWWCAGSDSVSFKRPICGH